MTDRLPQPRNFLWNFAGRNRPDVGTLSPPTGRLQGAVVSALCFRVVLEALHPSPLSVATLPLAEELETTALAFDWSGAFLAIAQEALVRIYRLSVGSCEQELQAQFDEPMRTHSPIVQHMSFSPDGRSLIAGISAEIPQGGRYGETLVLDVEQGALRWRVSHDEGNGYEFVAISPDSSTLLTGIGEHIDFIALDSGHLQQRLASPFKRVLGEPFRDTVWPLEEAAFSANDKRLALLSSQGDIAVCERSRSSSAWSLAYFLEAPDSPSCRWRAAWTPSSNGLLVASSSPPRFDGKFPTTHTPPRLQEFTARSGREWTVRTYRAPDFQDPATRYRKPLLIDAVKRLVWWSGHDFPPVPIGSRVQISRSPFGEEKPSCLLTDVDEPFAWSRDGALGAFVRDAQVCVVRWVMRSHRETSPAVFFSSTQPMNSPTLGSQSCEPTERREESRGRGFRSL